MNDFEGLHIALTGEMRSGKDTIGKYLVKELGFKRFAFGDGIRKTCKQLFPEHFENSVKPRKLLQDFGQFCVGIKRNVWVDMLFEEMNRTTDENDNIVITDLRQPHEYEALVQAGFIIVKVNTDIDVRVTRMKEKGEPFDPKVLEHETERFIRDYEVDYELDNNGTPEELIQQTKIMLMNIVGGGM